jgi:hypothetical protein
MLPPKIVQLSKSNSLLVDLTGQVISCLTVLGYAGTREGGKGSLWRCRCICGKEVIRRGDSLKRPNKTSIKSCGCKNPGSTTHGLSNTAQYHMWEAAKFRAKDRGLNFDIEVADIVIPEMCPVLGLRLKANVGISKVRHSSPTLDRIDSSKGYIKGNVRVISHRANTLKSDATVEELSKVLEDVIKSSMNWNKNIGCRLPYESRNA